MLRLVFVPLRGGRHRALTGRQRAQLSCVLWIYPDNGQTDYLEQWQNYWDNGAPWFSVGVRIGLWHFFFLIWFRWDGVGVWQRRSKGLGRNDLSVDTDLEQYFLFIFFLSLAKAAAFASKRKEARVDSTMLYSHFIRHYNTFMIMLLNMWSMFFITSLSHININWMKHSKRWICSIVL